MALRFFLAAFAGSLLTVSASAQLLDFSAYHFLEGNADGQYEFVEGMNDPNAVLAIIRGNRTRVRVSSTYNATASSFTGVNLVSVNDAWGAYRRSLRFTLDQPTVLSFTSSRSPFFTNPVLILRTRDGRTIFDFSAEFFVQHNVLLDPAEYDLLFSGEFQDSGATAISQRYEAHFTTVPEPTTLATLSLGALAWASRSVRRRKTSRASNMNRS
jgi:hypothetical protein